MIDCPTKPTLQFDFLAHRWRPDGFLKHGEVETIGGGKRKLVKPEFWKGERLTRSEMSFLTGTGTEVFYESVKTGTQLLNFTTDASLMGTLPVCSIPAAFWGTDPRSATGKCLRIKACGRLGTTSAPTFTWKVNLQTSSTFSTGAGIGFATAALTGGTTVTLAPWYLDCEIILQALAGPAGSTIAIMGEIRSPLGLASPFGGTIPASNTAFTSTSFDTTVTQYVWLSAACGTASNLNLMELDLMKVYGEN